MKRGKLVAEDDPGGSLAGSLAGSVQVGRWFLSGEKRLLYLQPLPVWSIELVLAVGVASAHLHCLVKKDQNFREIDG